MHSVYTDIYFNIKIEKKICFNIYLKLSLNILNDIIY